MRACLPPKAFAFLNDLLFSGILFCLLPTLFLVAEAVRQDRAAAGGCARGMKRPGWAGSTPKLSSAVSLPLPRRSGAELLATSGTPLIEWEAEGGRKSGNRAGRSVLVVAAVIAVAAIVLR